ncbi:MAG TPA: pentapeptide repeat-containing protein [Pseudonocardiaceae bacterium]
MLTGYCHPVMFRELAGGRAVRRPALDKDGLRRQTADFAGAFDLDAALVADGEDTDVSGEGSITHSLLRKLNLSGANLGSLYLMDTVLEDVDLSNASVQRTNANRVELLRCRAIGLRLSLQQAADLYVDDCRIDFATIRIMKIKKIAVFAGCSFRETTIAGDLSNAVFADCDLTETEFAATGANACDLRGCRLEGARGLHTLRGAIISREQAISVADQLATEIGLVIKED